MRDAFTCEECAFNERGDLCARTNCGSNYLITVDDYVLMRLKGEL